MGPKFGMSGMGLAAVTALFVLKAGDTMTGRLTINANAIAAVTPVSGALLHLSGADDSASNFECDSYGTTNASIIMRHALGSNASPTALTSGAGLFNIQGRGYGSTAYSGNRARLQFVTSQAWTDAAQGSKATISVTPSGSTTLSDGGFTLENSNAWSQTTNIVLDSDRVLRARVFTVGTLPANVAGKRTMVSDALAPAFGAAVAAGGAVTVPVFNTGAAWNVG